MKIRIRANSVRFRLTKSEVDKLCTEGMVEETTPFANKDFMYRVEQGKEADGLSAAFTDNLITLYLPENHAKGWNTNDQVGFENEMEFPGGKRLSLLLEKDFNCLTPRGEDETDNYINPKAVQ